jgi:hypothetical protein
VDYRVIGVVIAVLALLAAFYKHLVAWNKFVF